MDSNLWFVPHPEAWRYRAALTRLAAEHGTSLNQEHGFRMAALFERLGRYADERVAAERASRQALPAPPARRLLTAAKNEDAGHSSVRSIRSGFWRD